MRRELSLQRQHGRNVSSIKTVACFVRARGGNLHRSSLWCHAGTLPKRFTRKGINNPRNRRKLRCNLWIQLSQKTIAHRMSLP